MTTPMLYLPKLKKEIPRPWFLPTREALKAQHELQSSLYFLIKQGDAFGERLRCVKCNRRHDYLTLNCIERPFTGLLNGLYAYYQVIQNNGLERYLTPEEKARYNTITDVLDGMPDIGSVHPEMARKLVRDLGPSDMKIGAVAIGVLEGIAQVHALKLVQKINDRGLRPKLVLEEPNPYDKIRMELQRAV